MEREVRHESPEKVAAWKAMWREIDAGKLKRAADCKCVDCGEPAKYLHHHKGYAPPNDVDVIPVCSACHGKRHGATP